MKHLVSIGGGFSSTIELPLAVIEKYGAENVDMVIACLAMESPDLWRLVKECERLTGKHIKRITYQPYRQYAEDAPEAMWWDIWDVFFQQGRMGSSLADPCSRVLKRETLRAYIQDNYPSGETVLHVGITGDEIDRMMAIQANWRRAGYRVEADLADRRTVGTSAQRCKAMLGWTPRLTCGECPAVMDVEPDDLNVAREAQRAGWGYTMTSGWVCPCCKPKQRLLDDEPMRGAT